MKKREIKKVFKQFAEVTENLEHQMRVMDEKNVCASSVVDNDSLVAIHGESQADRGSYLDMRSKEVQGKKDQQSEVINSLLQKVNELDQEIAHLNTKYKKQHKKLEKRYDKKVKSLNKQLEICCLEHKELERVFLDIIRRNCKVYYIDSLKDVKRLLRSTRKNDTRNCCDLIDMDNDYRR